MTRINLVPPSELYDQHLMAEYREILMVPAALKRTLRSARGLSLADYSKSFTLNKGHVTFFYNKGKYLHARYKLLVQELTARGFKLDKNRHFPSEIFIKNNLYKDWSPTNKDLKLIRTRLHQKLSQKPAWYRKTIPQKKLK